jgi:hypothetical protein
LAELVWRQDHCTPHSVLAGDPGRLTQVKEAGIHPITVLRRIAAAADCRSSGAARAGRLAFP